MIFVKLLIFGKTWKPQYNDKQPIHHVMLTFKDAVEDKMYDYAIELAF